MSKIYLVAIGDNPFKRFFDMSLAARHQQSDSCCFFSTREKALRHLYEQTNENFYPDKDEDIEWAASNIWIMNENGMDVDDYIDSYDLEENVLEEYLKRSGNQENLFEITLDQ